MKIQLKKFVNKETEQPNWFWLDININKRVGDIFTDKRAAVLWAITHHGRENIVSSQPQEWSGRERRINKNGDRRSGVDKRTEIRFEPGTARRKSSGRRKEDKIHWL